MGCQVFSLGSAVYVRYNDHVLFRNLEQPIEQDMERETLGWLTKENGEILLIEHDRTAHNFKLSSDHSNGLVILKSCALEIRAVPLQEISKGLLNSKDAKSRVRVSVKEAKN